MPCGSRTRAAVLGAPYRDPADVFSTLNTWELGLILFAIVVGTTAVGLLVGRSLRSHADTLKEPYGALQAALLGVVGLILAFGLTMAVGRYETRRTAVVDDANAIGTAYLRAQTIAEPQRSESLALMRRYTDTDLLLAHSIPNGRAASAAVAEGSLIQRRLWNLAGQALDRAPNASATRLYVDSLNTMIDMQTVRVASLNDRIPTEVLTLEIVGAALALGLLALYLAIVGRGPVTVIFAAALVTMLLLVTFDLDRPVRGLITVPSAPLDSLRTSMALPPAFPGPTGP
jgi:hypothetical protein